MKISRITPQETSTRLGSAFNAPAISSDEERERFEEEWHRTRDGLKVELDRLGTWDAFANGDYFLDDTLDDSRGIGFELTSEKMQRPELIDRVSQYLRTIPEIYDVHVTAPFGFDLFIGRDYALFCGTDSEAKRFGIA